MYIRSRKSLDKLYTLGTNSDPFLILICYSPLQTPPFQRIGTSTGSAASNGEVFLGERNIYLLALVKTPATAMGQLRLAPDK